MIERSPLRVFLDANVFIEALLVQSPPAVSIFHLASESVLRPMTCNMVIEDIEGTILDKAGTDKVLDLLVSAWLDLKQQSSLEVSPDPSSRYVVTIKQNYLTLMRHLADIPVLAAAIQARPDMILSGNRKHFNDRVSQKCGIPIYSCHEFLMKFVVS